MLPLFDFFKTIGILTIGLASGYTISGLLTNLLFDDNEELIIPFTEKYYYQFKYMNDTNTDFGDLSKIHLVVTPENDKIRMCYNSEYESWDYWCDKNTIQYPILNAVAELYALTYDCKQVCIDYREELEKAREKQQQNISKIQEKQNEQSKTNVFAKAKQYNLKKQIKTDVSPEKCNKFRYRGKFSDFTENNEKPQAKKSNLTISDWIKNKKSN